MEIRQPVNVEVVRIGGLYDNEKKHQMGSVYDQNGLCPTIDTCTGENRQPIIVEQMSIGREEQTMLIDSVKRIGNLSNSKSQSRTVYDTSYCSPTLVSGMDHGNTMPFICEKKIVAMRGRNPDNPSDRTVGSPTEQRLELNSQGICNAITTVQKDNMVMEKRMESQYRVRKLTPMETWRLMDFSVEDFHKAEAVNSNTQLYKQAGNSIVRNVLVAIFGQMLPGKEEVYKNVVS